MSADTDSALYSWSTTESNNKPVGTTTVGTNWDDNLRMIQKVVRGWLATKGADIASAGTTDLGAVEGFAHDITGTTTITGFGTVAAGIHKVVKFEGVLTLTHNATSLILPRGVNITTADGDVGWFSSEGSGNWRCLAYSPASGPLPYIDTNAIVVGSADSTKKVRFEVDGLTTATTRVITVPDADIQLANWSTGDVKLTLKTSADSGWVMMDDGTIGNAASAGTTRANADTVTLFTLLWNNTIDANCAVSTGRGANAAADYAANKTIALPKALGRALAGAGSGSGLTARALAVKTGNETHTLTTAEAPAFTVRDYLVAGVGSSAGPGANQFGDTTNGGGGAHNNMQPTVFLNVMIKL